MSNLVVSEFIKIEVNDQLEQEVSARNLHQGLGIQKHFTQWWDYQVEKLSLVEGRDFLTKLLESTGGRPGVDYKVSIDIAKHICMISGGELAYRIREYFIQVERAWNSPEAVMARALKMADKKLAEYQGRLAELTPKADAYDNFIGKENLYAIHVVAKKLAIPGMGEKNLFVYLRGRGILCSSKSRWNQPYQEYVDSGYFVVRDGRSWSDSSGNEHTPRQTFVTPKGVDFICRMLKKDNYVIPEKKDESVVLIYT